MSANHFISIVEGSYPKEGKVRAVELMLKQKYLFNQTEFEHAVSSELWGQYAKRMVNRLIDIHRALAHCHEKWIPDLVSMGANVKALLKRDPFTSQYLRPGNELSIVYYASLLADQFQDDQISKIQEDFFKFQDKFQDEIDTQNDENIKAPQECNNDLDDKIEDFLSKIDDSRAFRTLASLIELEKC